MKATGTRWLRILLLVAGLAILATGMGVLLLTTPKWYIASARVKVESLTSVAANPHWEPYFLQNEFELIQSPALLTNVIAKLDLQTPAGRKLGFLKKLRPEDACAFLRSSFSLRSVRSTTLVEICASHEDPDAAALMANAIAEAYLDLPAERQRHFNRSEMASFEAAIADMTSGYRDEAKAILQAAKEGRLTARVHVEMVDPATPPTSQVSLERKLNQWLNPGSYRLPGPPAHPHRKLSIGLVALGMVLGVIGLVLRERQTV